MNCIVLYCSVVKESGDSLHCKERKSGDLVYLGGGCDGTLDFWIFGKPPFPFGCCIVYALFLAFTRLK